jgi:hypothetical protein
LGEVATSGIKAVTASFGNSKGNAIGELVWINVTPHPTAEWIAQQITEAFPWNETPRYLIRDRDGVYGAAVARRLRAMGIRDKPITPGSPWQNCFAERLIGSLRRECVDHIVALGERHLRQVLKSYASYYNTARTHRSLAKDAPLTRPIQRIGRIVSHALIGGLQQFAIRCREVDHQLELDRCEPMGPGLATTHCVTESHNVNPPGPRRCSRRGGERPEPMVHRAVGAMAANKARARGRGSV